MIKSGNIVSRHRTGPLGRETQAAKHTHGRGLTGTVDAEKPEDLAAIDIEVYVIYGGKSTETLCQAAYADYWSAPGVVIAAVHCA